MLLPGAHFLTPPKLRESKAVSRIGCSLASMPGRAARTKQLNTSPETQFLVPAGSRPLAGFIVPFTARNAARPDQMQSSLRRFFGLENGWLGDDWTSVNSEARRQRGKGDLLVRDAASLCQQTHIIFRLLVDEALEAWEWGARVGTGDPLCRCQPRPRRGTCDQPMKT
jgi:hypothetical protein